MRKRFGEEQIVRILKEAERAGTAREVVCKHNISEQTFYRWKNKYGGLEASDVTRLKALERENTALQQVVAELTLINRILRVSRVVQISPLVVIENSPPVEQLTVASQYHHPTHLSSRPGHRPKGLRQGALAGTEALPEWPVLVLARLAFHE